ncbi:hypothetical protein Ciccas_007102 [Cichlidogyrus casuarinus]|uniref:NADPH--hemoprotein reductase n=1 Tax=Cichlidogyrus casuarinus TaxID=1844966 RepID=A0ABD2Q4H6_9PLAT
MTNSHTKQYNTGNACITTLDLVFGSAIVCLSTIFVYRKFFAHKSEYDELLLHIEKFPKRKNSSSRRPSTDQDIILDFVQTMKEHECISKFPRDWYMVFFIATYGEGAPTDNVDEFVNFLKDFSLDLDHVHYLIFGLGNSTYKHFNAAAKTVDKLMRKKGASRVAKFGLGDDDRNLELDFIQWRDSVAKHFKSLGLQFSEASFMPFELSYSFEILSRDKTPVFKGEPMILESHKLQEKPFHQNYPFLAEIVQRRELYSRSASRSCLHMRLSLKDSNIEYQPGDHLGIYAANDSSRVDLLEQRLRIDFEQIVALTALNETATRKHPFPCPCSLRTAFMHYLDIKTCPGIDFLAALIGFTSDKDDVELLKKLASDTEMGSVKREKWIKEAGRDLVDILEAVPSCTPPVSLLCQLLPRLQIRYYSISSAPDKECSFVEVTVAVIDYENELKRRVKGVATGMLASLCLGDKVSMFKRSSTFRMPEDYTVPLILIGPGTGFAPFRGFLQARSQIQNDGHVLGKCLLFFGCRNKDKDFMYEEELCEYLERGVLSNLFLAFSRDPVSQEDEKLLIRANAKKIYVQTRIKEHGQLVWQLLNDKGAYLYICGDAKNMAVDVRKSLIDVALEHGQLSPAQAENFFNNLESQNRFLSDVWS